MPELRKDYILDRWVIINPKRGLRPDQFKKPPEKKGKEGFCFFCPGHEDTTPPEIGRVEKNGKWVIRLFPNKFGINSPGKGAKLKSKGMLNSKDALGAHEVLVETQDHKKQLWDLTDNEIKTVLKFVSDRVTVLSKPKDIKYVSLFKNHGSKAGTSLVHSHMQLVTLEEVPTTVNEKISAVKKSKDKCPYCKIAKNEAKSERKILESGAVVAIAPYASRFNFEAMILPKRHVKSMNELKDKELLDLAKAIRKVLVKLKAIDAAYNILFYHAPAGKDLHFHIEITPRLALFAGFEYQSGFIVNVVAPEDAAKYYRSKK